MRTTITLEPDVAEKLKKLAHITRRSFKATIDEVLRRGLATQERAASQRPFIVEPHAGGFRPGIDQTKLNQLSDQLETEEFLRKSGFRR
jgi:predicted transcriptional regulator